MPAAGVQNLSPATQIVHSTSQSMDHQTLQASRQLLY